MRNPSLPTRCKGVKVAPQSRAMFPVFGGISGSTKAIWKPDACEISKSIASCVSMRPADMEHPLNRREDNRESHRQKPDAESLRPFKGGFARSPCQKREEHLQLKHQEMQSRFHRFGQGRCRVFKSVVKEQIMCGRDHQLNRRQQEDYPLATPAIRLT